MKKLFVLLAFALAPLCASAGFQPEPYERFFRGKDESCILIMGEPLFGAEVGDDMRRVYRSEDCRNFTPLEKEGDGSFFASGLDSETRMGYIVLRFKTQKFRIFHVIVKEGSFDLRRDTKFEEFLFVNGEAFKLIKPSEKGMVIQNKLVWPRLEPLN